jgi:hypothetical protein
VIEQLRQGLEQNIQVGLSESRVLGEERRNKLMRAVQAVGNGVFSAHLAARGLFVAFFGLDPVCIPGIGERNARDRMLHTEHRRLWARESELHRSANLTAVLEFLASPGAFFVALLEGASSSSDLPVVITAPNVRTSKKFRHIHWRASSLARSCGSAPIAW